MKARVLAADAAHVWHPYTPLDDALRAGEPLVVARAEGSTLYDAEGRGYLDANSSWWVAALGHGHPRLVARLAEQAAVLAHCALAGITHENAALLAEELVQVAPPGLERVFYSDDGSTAVEVALRMALQAWRQLGRPDKRRFLALDGAFHGDTLGAASLGGVDVFVRGMGPATIECLRVPWETGDTGETDDEEGAPGEAAYERTFQAMADVISSQSETLAAVIVEPVVQGAAGMRIYPPRLLRALAEACRRHDVLLIADEVFTGYGRTGRMWACEHAGVTPDILCLGKAFASLLPMAATLTTPRVYEAFRGGKDRALYYGHTFCGNPLGAALAREVLAIYADERVVEKTQRKSEAIAASFARLGHLPGARRARALGMIGAVDLGSTGYLADTGWHIAAEARKRGVYLRPLGDTIYVAPPLIIADEELGRLLAVVEESVAAVLTTSP